jgi:glucose/arabinose dehydrogenase
VLGAPTTLAQEREPDQDATLNATLFRPEQLDFDASLLGRLAVPEGFRLNVFASGLGQPRVLLVNPDGSIFISRRGTDDVVAIKDDDQDGVADRSWVVVPKLEGAHGIARRDNIFYIATEHEVFTATLGEDGRADRPRRIVNDLPDAGQHPNRTLAFGSDYVQLV